MEKLPSDTQVIKTDCALCVNCCGINAYVSQGKLIKVEGMKEHPVNRGGLCPKGEKLVEYLYAEDRLKYPMKKENGTWKRITWDEALDTIAAKLQEIKKKDGARALAVYCGSVGVEHVEAAFFAQRFRGAYGTPNMLSVESGCFRQRILTRQMTFGRYITEDVESANCIVLWGHNPDDSRWIVGDWVRQGLERGAKLIVIDPKRIPLAKEGLHLQLRPGTDCALALGMMHVIISEGLHDQAFLDEWTVGFEKLKEHVKAYPPEKVEEITWVPASDIKEAARIFATHKGATIVQGTCTLDRQINDVQNSRALALLQTITGNIENPGGWVASRIIPLTDLRIPVDDIPLGDEEYPLHNVLWGRRAAYGHAMLLPKAVLDGKPYPIKALIVTAGNPALTMPDSKTYRKTLEKLDLVVTVDLFMSETAELSDIVLPACSFLEQTGIGGYPVGLMHGISYIMHRKKVIDPIGESKPDWLIWSELGRKMGYGEFFPWKTDEEMVEHLLVPSKLTLKQLEEHPEGILYAPKSYGLYKKLGFKTPSRKIEIYSETLAQAGFDPLPTYKEPTRSPVSTPDLAKDYPLIMVTGARIREYIHTQLRNVPAVHCLSPEPVAELHPASAAKYGIVDGKEMIVETKEGSIKLTARLTPDIAEKVISVPHGWAKANVNELVNSGFRDAILGCPEDKGLLCRVRPA
jgi:formate dehydrogenase (coenzyme F420) alpha subunit